MQQNWNTMPKIELHCHLDGSLPLALVETLARQNNLDILSQSLPQRLTAPAHCSSLVEYLECFSLPLSCLQTAEALKQAAFAVSHSMAQEGVLYTELRFAPLSCTQQGLSPEQAVFSVLEGLAQGHSQHGMHYGLLLCAMRHQPAQQNLLLLDIASHYRHQGVVGVDLAGDEKGYPASLHKSFFSKALQMDIPFTIHAGEADGPESIHQALELGAKRIGHGVTMKDDAALRQFCKQNQIGIEMCPLSNFQTKAATSWQTYPLASYLAQGLLVSLNTDNRTVSQTSLTKELRNLEQQTALTRQQALTLMHNAVQTSFAPHGLKQTLHATLQTFWAQQL